MLVVVARAVQPPHRPGTPLSCQRVQHGEDWGGPHSSADQDDGACAVAKDEVATWSGDVQKVADLDAFVEVATAGALAL